MKLQKTAEYLHNLYSTQNNTWLTKSRRMRLSGHVALMGQTKDIYKIFVKKHEGKRPLERSQYRKKLF
jgi:hypothetical protein